MDSENIPPRQLRRSTRQSLSATSQGVNFEPTPRGPLKRAKKTSKAQSETPAVNGTNDNGTDDEESPKKKSRLEAGDMLVEEDGHCPSMNEPEPMETQDNGEGQKDTKDLIKPLQQTQNPPGPHGDVNFMPFVVLGQRCSLSYPESESVIKHQVEQPKNKNVSASKQTTQTAPSKRTYDKHHVPVTNTSMDEYKREMLSKIPGNHYVQSKYPKSVTTTITQRRATDSSAQKTSVAEKRQETKKTSVYHPKTGTSSKGFLKYFWQFIFLLLLSAGFLLGFKHIQTFQRTNDSSAHLPRSVNPGLFVDELSRVVPRFPSQRPELWKRSQIHLKKHLDLSHPTEPVSMILTAGVKAQKTLHCLAHDLAAAFSTALNTSVVAVDGASLSNQDSDQVKLDIDSQLKVAFGGDKLTAVVHRFEELPPGSTLIFYRYCDHETAAYKRAFILFTVLLSGEDITAQQSLKEVEEMVRDHVAEKFVSNETAFNKMDADKFSGLWSRIAHLILPVVHEDEIEQKGC